MVPEWLPVHRLAVLFAFLVAFGIVYAVDRPRGAWGRRLRSRLLFGIPWGTLLAMGFVVAVYLFAQSGLEHRYRPVVIPFRAWSYLYPEGMLLAGFSHASFGHLTGNLIGTLVAGSLAEYAYGHFPRERGSAAFASLRTNPYVRALVFAPAAILLTGSLTALFALGPVIGFSGVVFALWGFALVHYPIGAIVALAGSRVVGLLWSVWRTPVVTSSASPSYGGPWWAGIAVQGHAVGLFIGVIVGLSLLKRRGERPSALRLFAGGLLFSVSQALWAVYWYLGNEQYVLYRGIGTALVVLLAAVIAVAGAAKAKPFVEEWAVPNPRTISESIRSATPRTVAFVALLLAFGAIAGPAVPVNMMTTADDPVPGESMSVDGYAVTYAEDVPNGMVSVIDVEAFGQSTTVNTSGVIVYNEERHIWFNAISKGQLAFTGTSRVELGGIGWRETVTAKRTGWRAVGGDPTYRIVLSHEDRNVTAFVSDPSSAEATIDGRNVSVAAVEDGFRIRVTRNGTADAATAPLPATNETVQVGGISFERVEKKLFAVRGDTRVRIANAETYR